MREKVVLLETGNATFTPNRWLHLPQFTP